MSDTLNLWPSEPPCKAPGAAGPAPTMEIHVPTKKAWAGMLVFPGGGYGCLAPHEEYWEWLNRLGIVAFVVKYRLGSDGNRHPAMLADALRAMRLAKSMAPKLGIPADRIGVMGSSAGGHLAATLLTHHNEHHPRKKVDEIDKLSAKPWVGVLCYPVVGMLPGFSHEGSTINLLGPEPSSKERKELSAHLHVSTDTPSCFIWHTFEDACVPVDHSIMLAYFMKTAGVPFELHVYEKGAHGLGLANGHPWTDELARWLKEKN